MSDKNDWCNESNKRLEVVLQKRINKVQRSSRYNGAPPTCARSRDSKTCPDPYCRGHIYALIGRLTSRARQLTRPPCHRTRGCCLRAVGVVVYELRRSINTKRRSE